MHEPRKQAGGDVNQAAVAFPLGEMAAPPEAKFDGKHGVGDAPHGIGDGELVGGHIDRDDALGAWALV